MNKIQPKKEWSTKIKSHFNIEIHKNFFEKEQQLEQNKKKLKQFNSSKEQFNTKNESKIQW